MTTYRFDNESKRKFDNEKTESYANMLEFIKQIRLK